MVAKKTDKVSAASVITALQKESRLGVLAQMDRVPEGYSTGNVALDWRIGCGGFPKGRITEQYGPKSSGKTTSALQALAIQQQECIAAGEGYVMFLDFEKALDEKYCRALGIDTSDPTFIYVMPDTFEEGAKIFRQVLATGELRIGVFDSVASMITEAETNKETGERMVSDRALLLHQFCRQITPVLERTGCAAIFLNHMMHKVDTSPIGQKLAASGIKQITKPGGEALNFYASLIIEYKQVRHLKADSVDPLTGEKVKIASQTDTKATLVKNKVGTPQSVVDLRIRYGRGFSQAYSVLRILQGNKIVKKTGAWYKVPQELAFGRETDFHGENALLSAWEDDPDWLALLVEKAKQVLDEVGDEYANLDESNMDEEDSVV